MFTFYYFGHFLLFKVKALKEKIAAKDDLREKYDPELLKLLYTGKVMDDEETVNSYSIKSDGFLVLVKQTPGKPKPPVYIYSFIINHYSFYFLFLAKKET